MLLLAIFLIFGRKRSTCFLSDKGLYMGRSILGYAITSSKFSPIWAMIQDGREMVVSPRRRMVRLGSTPVTMAALTAPRSRGTGGGDWPAVCATVLSVNKSN